MAYGKHITDLPDELLLAIFSNLSIEDLAFSVQHVNKHWKDVTQDDSLWRNQVFSPECKMSDEEIARHLMNMPALKAYCPARGTNTKNIIPTMCKYCRDIRRIEFGWGQKLSNFRLQDIINKYPHLEILHLPLPKEPDQLRCAILVGQLQNLTTLNFTDKYFEEVAGGILEAIAEGCPALLHLDLGYIKFQDRDVQYLLAISACPEMTDSVLDNILKCRELEVLILSWNSQLLGTNFLLIPSNLIHLTVLDVQGCDALVEKCVHELQVMMPNLTQ